MLAVAIISAPNAKIKEVLYQAVPKKWMRILLSIVLVVVCFSSVPVEDTGECVSETEPTAETAATLSSGEVTPDTTETIVTTEKYLKLLGLAKQLM